jgi:hypothetical protein
MFEPMMTSFKRFGWHQLMVEAATLWKRKPKKAKVQAKLHRMICPR